LYLSINKDIYDNDKKKIGYTLALMDQGDAKSWKTGFSKKTSNLTMLVLKLPFCYWLHLVEISGGVKTYLGSRIMIINYPTLSTAIRGRMGGSRAYWMTLPFWEVPSILNYSVFTCKSPHYMFLGQ
jgi:hypothetical protein